MILRSRVFGTGALGLSLGLSGCGSNSGSTSTPAFAHYQAEEMLGTPMAHLEALKQGFTTDFKTLRICIEAGKPGISDAQLVLETKLAYVTWLSKAGEYGQEDFERFKWVTKPKCRQDDAAFIGAVILADMAKEEEGDSFRSHFNEARLQCTTDSKKTRKCSVESTTLGWGGPGRTVTWSTSADPTHWTKIESRSPASALLSPFVTWTDLVTGLSADPKHDADVTKKVATAYEDLLKVQTPTFVQLVKFTALLRKVKLLAGYDAGFHAATEKFLASGKASIDKVIPSRQPVLHVLIHEVGHQFGMDHADNPSETSVNEATAVTHEDKGQQVTAKASMAYGDPFVYLTKDDIAGIASAGSSVREMLASHR